MPLSRLNQNRRGASMAEYGALAGLIAAVALVGVQQAGDAVSELTNAVAAEVEDAVGAVAGDGGADGTAGDDAATGTPDQTETPDTLSAYDAYGTSVDLDGPYLIAGAPGDDGVVSGGGAVHVTDLRDGSILKFTGRNALAGATLGASVAIDGTTAVAGAHQSDVSGEKSGKAYVFDAATGQVAHELVPDDATAWDHFGHRVAVDGGVVAVAAPYHDGQDAWAGGSDVPTGSVYLYDAASGALLRRIASPDPVNGGDFGYAIALDAGRLLVSEPTINGADGTPGSAYLFDVATGDLIRTFPGDGLDQNDALGYWSLDLDGSVAAFSLRGSAAGSYRGEVRLVDVATGNVLQSHAAADGLFGEALDLEGGTLLVGAPLDATLGDQAGTAFLIDLDTGTRTAVTGFDTTDDDQFAKAVALDGGRFAVGAPWHDEGATNTGFVYTFD